MKTFVKPLIFIASVAFVSYAYYFYLTNIVLVKRRAEREQVKSAKVSTFSTLLQPLVFEPASLSIPVIGLKDVKIVEVGVEPDGRLEVPKNFDEAGWYVNGPKAGEDGNAIIAAHYDRVGGYPAAFYNLVKIAKDDIVEIKDRAGKVWKFKVYEISYVDINDPDRILKAYENTDDPILTLITCGGVWDFTNHDYSKRLLVKARKTE